MEDFIKECDHEYEDVSKNKKELLNRMVNRFQQEPTNVELCWRLVRTCLAVADSFEQSGNKTEAKRYTEESLQWAKKSVEIDNDSMEAHKWYCAAVGRMAKFAGIRERINLGHEFKKHHDVAIKIDPNDRLMHHMYGRWCYEVASLGMIERKLAETFFGILPKATYEDAMNSLQQAHSLHSLWKTNQLWIAKVFIATKKYPEAIHWIDSALAIATETEDDQVSNIELKELEYKYARYRINGK